MENLSWQSSVTKPISQWSNLVILKFGGCDKWEDNQENWQECGFSYCESVYFNKLGAHFFQLQEFGWTFVICHSFD